MGFLWGLVKPGQIATIGRLPKAKLKLGQRAMPQVTYSAVACRLPPERSKQQGLRRFQSLASPV
jgi:hypothetical protein